MRGLRDRPLKTLWMQAVLPFQLSRVAAGQQRLDPAVRIDSLLLHEVGALHLLRHVDDARDGNRLEAAKSFLDQLA